MKLLSKTYFMLAYDTVIIIKCVYQEPKVDFTCLSYEMGMYTLHESTTTYSSLWVVFTQALLLYNDHKGVWLAQD